MDTWTYDPDDGDTYPSVCITPGEIYDRFGLTGGEVLTEKDGTITARRPSGRVLWRWKP